MKNIKFSRLFAAVAFVAILALAGCKNQPEESSKAIEGTWRGGDYKDKHEITGSTYKNYYFDGEKDVLYFSLNKVEIVEKDSSSGYVYGQFDDEEHCGWNATVGQWYAIYYFDLCDDAVKISQAAGEKGGCDTLEEAKETFTVENGYMSKAAGKYSTCAKE